jgi:hypothetical protein
VSVKLGMSSSSQGCSGLQNFRCITVCVSVSFLFVSNDDQHTP